MWKFAKRIVAVFFVLVLAASLAILCLCLDADAQNCEEATPQPEFKAPNAVAPHTWTVSFRFKQKPPN